MKTLIVDPANPTQSAPHDAWEVRGGGRREGFEHHVGRGLHLVQEDPLGASELVEVAVHRDSLRLEKMCINV